MKLQFGLVHYIQGPSWLWSYGSWIYNYLCSQCLSPLKFEFEHCSWWGVLDTTLCDKVCQWFVTGRSFYPGTTVSSTNKTDCHNVAEILLKVALNTIKIKKRMHTIYMYKNNVVNFRFFIKIWKDHHLWLVGWRLTWSHVLLVYQ